MFNCTSCIWCLLKHRNTITATLGSIYQSKSVKIIQIWNPQVKSLAKKFVFPIFGGLRRRSADSRPWLAHFTNFLRGNPPVISWKIGVVPILKTEGPIKISKKKECNKPHPPWKNASDVKWNTPWYIFHPADRKISTYIAVTVLFTFQIATCF